MKPFSLEEYLKNPSRKLITGDGRKVKRILCTDAMGPYPIIALIDYGSYDKALSYTRDGNSYIGGLNEDDLFEDDLFFVSEKHEGWINIFKDNDGNDYVGQFFIFGSKEEAEKEGKKFINYMRTIKIEWEE